MYFIGLLGLSIMGYVYLVYAMYMVTPIDINILNIFTYKKNTNFLCIIKYTQPWYFIAIIKMKWMLKSEYTQKAVTKKGGGL